ncbi:signal transduction histidine kinase/ligand-binding sensor domain-containing protein/DNA-binding response OmpR family regulator [Filimonas zeae]|uniref:hybrid sensor histidine kinase/response regulator transcription factor n=1 Tax=Filimonas zeae TaxID=1737353 RepID=UPI0016637C7C|nr:hybrid sensor histidine kinase/response regulator transcription factor [Filimonas zeae]MDR6340631.1 signal transduction histidine kinase/ligand-binding sensor domain-containing protein/DNA-binding response OmpR family regulator [Filimonas zeae]
MKNACLLLVGYCLQTLLLYAQPGVPLTELGIENGMSNNSVTSIYQDRRGFIWIGTNDGLNRYDGYAFKIFRNTFGDSTSLLSNRINCITADKSERLWIGTKEGLCVYRQDSALFRLPKYRDKLSNQLLPFNIIISDIKVRTDNAVYVATAGRGLVVFDNGRKEGRQVLLKERNKTTGKYNVQAIAGENMAAAWLFVTGQGLCVYKGDNVLVVDSSLRYANSMVLDRNGSLWIGAENGLHRFDIRTGRYTAFYNEASGVLNSNVVMSVFLDKDQQLWVQTDGGGIAILDPATGIWNKGRSDTLNAGLSSRAMTVVQQDREGRMWIGSLRGGIHLWDNNKPVFVNKSHDPDASKGPVSDFMLSFYEDAEKNIWVGTDGNGISIWNRQTNRFSHMSHSAAPGSLGANFVTGITGDKEGNIWVGTFGGGVNRYRGNGRFEYYPLYNSEAEDKNVWRIYQDKDGDVWASTVRNGRLYLLDKTLNRFVLFDRFIYDVIALYEDKAGQLWAGNFNELIRIEKKAKKYTRYVIGKPVRAMAEDANNDLWVGTEGGGLLLFDRKSGTIKERLTEKEGLSNNAVLNILTDHAQHFWIATYNGIGEFDPVTRVFTNYYQADGLPGNEWNYNAALKLHNGELLFGGINGFTVLNPEQMKERTAEAPVYLTGMQVNGSPLDGFRGSLTLPFHQATIAFDYVALEYSVPGKIQYAYYLEGWDKDWNYVHKRRSGNYSHLTEGTYRLLVKATNGAGEWGKETQVLEIVVLPPWYRSWWAYMLYVLVVSGGIYLVHTYKKRQEWLKYEVQVEKINARNERERAQKEILIAEKERQIADNQRQISEQEKELALKEREINEKRVSFFTNIAHEFRSPLTLIINPVQSLLNTEDSEGIRDELQVVQRNAKRMLGLVDQLLLFRKAESEAGSLAVSRISVIDLCREVYQYFVHEARSKKLEYVFEAVGEKPELYADREKIEVSLYNLISNALKYTPAGGRVVVAVREEGGYICLSVQDTGYGFTPEIGARIFDKFYRAEGNDITSKPGFGIGLYLVKYFTELQHGRVTWQSESGKGSCFTLSFLTGKEHFAAADMVVETTPVTAAAVLPEKPQPVAKASAKQAALPALASSKPVMLVVDDDAEMRRYIQDMFAEECITYEAENGTIGFEMARQLVPDIIVSDIVMPGISGVTFCKMIRAERSLAHIPLLLLTATSSADTQLQSAEGGADDYVIKPFSAELLRARVGVLLRNRSQVQQYLFDEVTHHINNGRISAEDKALIERCAAIIEEHLDDAGFTIEVLAKEMGMSTSNLYKKIKAATNYSTNGFVRFVRLRKAAMLLIDSHLNINEIAFVVGISDIKYFREQFHRQFGVNPSEYMKKYRRSLGRHFKMQ